jgi:8-oxo-dGTP pyrophosphatase MutT (NUDIX family)
VRQRATVVIMRGGKVLLVRDKGRTKFSLPGGGINKGEPTISAAVRELNEELGLRVTDVKRMQECDFKGSLSEHKVCLIQADGEPHFRGHELDKFVWWDMKEFVPVYAHVTHILNKISEGGLTNGQ